MTNCHHTGGTGWCEEHKQSIASCATQRERERCAKIVSALKDEVRSKSPGLEYHLVLAEQQIKEGG